MRRARNVCQLVVRWAVLTGAVAAGCAGGTTRAATACGPIRGEALDRNYLVHVLPGAATPQYLTNPPTSGAHQPSPRLRPVQRRPLPKPVQVGVLEGGNVLIQYRGLGRADVARLEALAGTRVVVAPAPDLGPGDRVVATAWTHKRSCRAVDIAALQEFVRRRVGKGSGSAS